MSDQSAERLSAEERERESIRRTIVEWLGRQRISLYLSKDIDHMVTCPMTCTGHNSHRFETTDECRLCGHDRSEHEDGFWSDDRGHPRQSADRTEDADGYVTVPLDWGGELGNAD